MARWHSCNVLQVGSDRRRVWQFDARNGSFALHREQTLRPGEPLPAGAVVKTWTSLWQKKLNVAWLPPEHVFVRVAQFPVSSPDETRAMVELQLERFSPIPVTQIVWSMHVLPSAVADMQTVIVTIVARSIVEEFLGQLEGQGYLADRLEVPLLDQLAATRTDGDGAWIYPEAQGSHQSALAAWWFGGVLRSVDFLVLSAGPERAAGLKDQLTQMAWAGELEGWLTAAPRWHLVADEATAADWLPALREGLEQAVEVTAPLPPEQTAAQTARRAAQADPKINLLPAEFATRYQQQFVDRLWMRGLGGVLALYLVGLAVYFIALSVLNFRTNGVETRAAALSNSYTNSVQTKLQYEILKERQELKFAALDAWQAVAELLPENVTLETMNFSDGRYLTLNGTAPEDEGAAVIDFSDRLRKYVKGTQPLFDSTRWEQLQTRKMDDVIRWNFGLELKRSENL